MRTEISAAKGGKKPGRKRLQPSPDSSRNSVEFGWKAPVERCETVLHYPREHPVVASGTYPLHVDPSSGARLPLPARRPQ